jgi:diadenosine tetraphosphatase ApaH/serine/threonine PP2A family protein phosphatase
MQMVVYGGATGGGSLASDDLYLLDLRQGEEQAQWIIVPVVGPTPGRRYGHVITFCMPYLLVFGGNTGSDAVNDVWFLSVEKAPFSWAKITSSSESPAVRVYHSAAQCLSGSAAGMMVIFGGRTSDQSALNDTWGLRRHRDGSWDWIKAPYRPGSLIPVARYQHSSLFINSVMVVIGGRTNQVAKVVPFEVYDTETSDWFSYQPIKRFRHACWSIEGMLYVHGGFEQDSPNVPTSSIILIDTGKIFKMHEALMPKMDDKEETKAGSKKSAVVNPNTITVTKVQNATQNQPTLGSKGNATQMMNMEEEKVFRLSNQAHVAVSFNMEDPESNFANFVRKVSIEHLQEESKKLGAARPKLPLSDAMKDPKDLLYSMFINQLLRPQDYSQALPRAAFMFRKEHVIELAKECQSILESQPIISKVRTPVKIYGNLHGNFQDLMRFFDLWKSPTENALGGDIDSFAYVFLGNYVDRGNRSLETICLLLALKLKYPDQIHLLRGNHEDRLINAVYGFGEECKTRLQENIEDPDSVFQALNNCFAWLPLATIIEDKIICIHAGIGPNITKSEDIYKIHRPIEISQDSSTPEQGILLNALWSDPTESDTELGFRRNFIRDHGNSGNIVKFGSDKLIQFLQASNLDLMIRGHEIALDGFDAFAGQRLLTVTSCTNYCGKLNNSACVLVVQKTYEIVPKLLLPSIEQEKLKVWVDDEEGLKKRPPTPPRSRNIVHIAPAKN